MEIKGFIKKIASGQIIKSFSIYTLANVINKCIPFFMLPIMTAYLTPADYGVISMITTIASFMLPFITLRVEDAIVRRYYYKNENIGVYIGNCFLIVATMWLVITSLMLLFGSFISKYSQVPEYVIWILPFYCVLQFLKSVIQYYWQVGKQPTKYGAFSITATTLELSIAIILIVCYKFNWIGRAISLISASFIMASFAVIYLVRHNRFIIKFDKEKITHAFKYGIWLVPGGIGLSIATLTNRFFLTNMISIDETGLYGVAASFAGVLSFITSSFNLAWVPFLFEKLSRGNDSDKRKIVKITYLYYLIIAVVVVLMYLVIKLFLPFFVDEKFYDATKYVPWLLIGHAFTGCYYMVTNYIMYVEKTKYTSFIALSVGVIGVGLNYLFINIYGATGAALAFATTNALMFLGTWAVSARVYRMPWMLHFKERKTR